MQMDGTRRKLPIGIQTFRTIREEGCYYADKTAEILRLAEGTHFFLSRPRRFGKSLLLDTIRELFKRDLKSSSAASPSTNGGTGASSIRPSG